MAPHIYLVWAGASQPKLPRYDLTGEQQGRAQVELWGWKQSGLTGVAGRQGEK
jgi:hypothetical protein